VYRLFYYINFFT